MDINVFCMFFIHIISLVHQMVSFRAEVKNLHTTNDILSKRCKTKKVCYELEDHLMYQKQMCYGSKNIPLKLRKVICAKIMVVRRGMNCMYDGVVQLGRIDSLTFEEKDYE